MKIDFNPEIFFLDPWVRPQKKPKAQKMANFKTYQVGYQTTSEEKYKINEKRRGAISSEKNPKNGWKLLKHPKWHFLVVLGTFLETGSSD